MIGRLAKAAYLFIVALMIAAYAMSSASNTRPPQEQHDEHIQLWMWC